MTQRLMTTRTEHDADYDECMNIVLSRNKIHDLIRFTHTVIRHLEDNAPVLAYQSVDKLYKELHQIRGHNERVIDTVGEWK